MKKILVLWMLLLCSVVFVSNADAIDWEDRVKVYDKYYDFMDEPHTAEKMLMTLGKPDRMEKKFGREEIWHYEKVFMDDVEIIDEAGLEISIVRGKYLPPNQKPSVIVKTLEMIFAPLLFLTVLPGNNAIYIILMFGTFFLALMFDGPIRFVSVYVFIGSLVILVI